MIFKPARTTHREEDGRGGAEIIPTKNVATEFNAHKYFAKKRSIMIHIFNSI